jgi:hypothetical protein
MRGSSCCGQSLKGVGPLDPSRTCVSATVGISTLSAMLSACALSGLIKRSNQLSYERADRKAASGM